MSWGPSYLRHSSTDSWEMFYPAGVAAGAGTMGNVTRDTMYLMPWFTGHGGCVRAIGMHRTTGSGSEAIRVALYARVSASDPAPGALIGDCGSMGLLSTWNVRSVTPSVVLSPHDCVWLALVVNSTFTQVQAVQGVLPPIFGITDRTDLHTGEGYLVASWAYASAFPSTAPTSVALQGGAGGEFPRIALAVGSIVPT